MSDGKGIRATPSLGVRSPGSDVDGTGAFVSGDVLDYVPERHHCREGIAIVRENGHALDTFWGSGDRHVLTDAELATARLRFRLSEFRALGANWEPRRDEWLTYADNDRQTVSGQHGHERIYYVRIGAEPHHATQVENARDRVAEAEENPRAAQSRLTWRLEELAELEARPA